MKKYVVLCILFVSIYLFHCGSSIRVKFDYMQNHDFKPYKTFDFIATPEDQNIHEKSRRRVKNAVINELEAKGFDMQFTQPDFRIAIHTSVDRKVDISTWGYHYAPYGVYHGGYGYWGTPTMSAYQYEEGTLVIDIIDPKSNLMIWRGVAQRVLPSNPDPDRIQEIINAAVRRVLYYWPPD